MKNKWKKKKWNQKGEFKAASALIFLFLVAHLWRCPDLLESGPAVGN